MALIEKHKGFAPSPIFGYLEDNAQLVPRGHYTRNEAFDEDSYLHYVEQVDKLREFEGKLVEMEDLVLAMTAITIGGVFSYNEFTHPLSDRLTDEP